MTVGKFFLVMLGTFALIFGAGVLPGLVNPDTRSPDARIKEECEKEYRYHSPERVMECRLAMSAKMALEQHKRATDRETSRLDGVYNRVR